MGLSYAMIQEIKRKALLGIPLDIPTPEKNQLYSQFKSEGWVTPTSTQQPTPQVNSGGNGMMYLIIGLVLFLFLKK